MNLNLFSIISKMNYPIKIFPLILLKMRRVGYDCDVYNKMCVPQPGGSGTYATLGDCQADCGPKCFVPEMTGPFITKDGFWHPGHPVHGSPCSKKLVPWENMREKGPYHLPCMSRVECETVFNPVDVPMAPMTVDAPAVCGGPCVPNTSHGCPPGCTCSVNPSGTGYNCMGIPLDTIATSASNCSTCSGTGCCPCGQYGNILCFPNKHSCNACEGGGCSRQTALCPSNLPWGVNWGKIHHKK